MEIEERKTKIKYKYDRYDKKSNQLRVQNLYSTKKSLLVCTFLSFIVVWLVYSLLFTDSESESPDDELCYGYSIKNKLCKKLDDYQITGQLCADLCLTEELNLPNCVNEIPFKSQPMSTNKFRYIQMPDSESTMIYVENSYIRNRLKEQITFDEFREQVHDFIMQRLNHSTTVEKIVDRIIYTTDVNSDQILNYQEANTLWTLLNNKATFYILVLGQRSYVPQIKNICGNLVELEEIKNHLNQPKDYSLIKSVFSSSIYWYNIDRLYRLKIALGILEFFSQAAEFNPNDEFGADSLLLCAPIDLSFGYTFLNEAKLVNYDWVLTTQEALAILDGETSRARPHCRSDADCVLTEQCSFHCDTNTNKCVGKLVKPQIAIYCEFLGKFFEDEKNISGELEGLLTRCAQLKPFYADSRVLYAKNEMPLSYSKVSEFVERREFWSRARDYSALLVDLERVMWERIRLAPDPKKPKKKTKSKKTEDEPTPK